MSLYSLPKVSSKKCTLHQETTLTNCNLWLKKYQIIVKKSNPNVGCQNTSCYEDIKCYCKNYFWTKVKSA